MGRGFDPSASWVPAALRKPVKEAIEMGWTPGDSRVKRGGWFIHSPKKTERFYVPITCKDPEVVAKKLRSLVNKAYLAESGGINPSYKDAPGAIERLTRLQDQVMAGGPVIKQGPDPTLTCPDCDGEWPEVEGFMAHQPACQADTRAALAAEQVTEVPEEGDEADRPSEGVTQSVTDSTESVHSGIIGTKEETPLVTESITPAPKPGPKPTPAKTGRRKGYTWTVVKGKENPLHEILYEAVRYTRRFNNETDSKYTLRLAQYIESENLLDRLTFADPDMQATSILERIRELVGGGDEQGNEEDAQTIKQLEDDVASKAAEIEVLTKKVTDLRGVLSTFSDLAKEANE